MISKITYAQYSGYFYDKIYTNQITKEKKEEIKLKKIFDEEKTKIQSSSETPKGRTIDYLF